MTYKERLAEAHPEAVNERYKGGVRYCPGTWFHGEIQCRDDRCDYDCEKCWNTEIPETEKTERKKAETTMDLIEKAMALNDKSVHLRFDPDGAISVDIVPVGEFVESADETVYEPAEPEGWREIEYGRDKCGKRIIVKNEPPEYVIVNVYCPENDRVYSAYWSVFKESWMIAISAPNGNRDEPVFTELGLSVTHWMPVPKAPKEGE